MSNQNWSGNPALVMKQLHEALFGPMSAHMARRFDEIAEELDQPVTDEESYDLVLWAGLDEAAATNLTPSQLARFHLYKARLKAKGHQWQDDAEDILTGWIWGEIGD